MKFVIFPLKLFCFFVIFALFSCTIYIDDDWYPDEWTRYNPDYSSAEIVHSADITESLMYAYQCISINYYNISVYGDYIYIMTGDSIIFIYDKNTLEFIKGLWIRTKTGPYTNWHLDMQFGGHIITDDFSAVLINSPSVIYDLFNDQPPQELISDYNHPQFVFFDLDTGVVEKVIDIRKALGIESKEKIDAIAGYDTERELYWYRDGAFDAPYYFFSYNGEEGTFELQYEKPGFTVGGRSSYHAHTVVIHGDVVWCGYNGNIYDAYIEKRDFENPHKRLQAINSQYLGMHWDVKHYTNKFAFDGEYMYLAIMDRYKNRDKVKLLKIRPLDLD